MKCTLLLALVVPTMAFIPMKPVVPMAQAQARVKGQTRMQADMPGLASAPGQPTIESWLLDNSEKKLCK